MHLHILLTLIFFIIDKNQGLVDCLNNTSSVLECCYIDYNLVRECLYEYYYLNHLSYENHFSQIQNVVSKYLIITYSTDNILDYSLYSFAINSAYAQFRNFLTYPLNNIKIFSSSSKSGFEFEPRDQRWNKVYILRELLMHQTMTNDIQYLVWMDSDLVVINFHFNIEDLIRTYPNADIMISQDAYSENGMVNTGCMIIRNTQWSISFLTDWWFAVDRVSAMDQHVFDLVYNNRKAINKTDIEVHIMILKIDEINSHIPAMKYQKPENKILHLAGESSIIRKKAFQLGFQMICNTSSSAIHNHNNLKVSDDLPLQLGLTQQWLSQLDYHNTLRSELIVILYKMYNCIPNPDIATQLLRDELAGDAFNFTSTCSLVEIITLQSELRDTMQSRSRIFSDRTITTISNNNVMNEDSQYAYIRYLYVLGLRWLFHYYFEIYQVFAKEDIASCSVQAHLTQLQYVVDAAFDLCIVEQDDVQLFTTLQLIQPMIDRIIFNTNEGFVHISSKGAALYYKFKYLEILARYFHRNNNIQQSLQVVEEAIVIWFQMSETCRYYGPGRSSNSIHAHNSYDEINDLIQLKKQIIIIMKEIDMSDDFIGMVGVDTTKNMEMIDYSIARSNSTLNPLSDINHIILDDTNDSKQTKNIKKRSLKKLKRRKASTYLN